ncbi:MAG: copper chaperone PCu(A)C [Rhodospirillales bacterium]|nr:copper chaperone PCu(A)C [Rhodospirillales bacterium]
MTRFTVAMLAALACASVFARAQAHDGNNHTVDVVEPWARATAGMSKTGAIYLTITAKDGNPDRLLSVATPVAGRAEMHTTIKDGDVAKMRHVSSIEVNPTAPTVLAPGGHHIMLTDLKATLKEGERVPLTLTFEKGGTVKVEALVRAAGAMGSGGSGGSSSGHGH